MIEAVIFDLDGTLLDTETLSTKAINQVLLRCSTDTHNPFVCDWELKKRILGMRGEDWANLIINEFNIGHVITWEEMVKEWETNLVSLYCEVIRLPGANKLTRFLEYYKIPRAIATSSNSAAVKKKKIYHPDLFNRFSVVVCGDDPCVKKGKPNPDIFIEASRRLNITDNSKVLVLEDAVSGVKAAKAAGMQCIAIPDSRLPQHHFEEADEVLKSMDEFDYEKYFPKLEKSFVSNERITHVLFDMDGLLLDTERFYSIAQEKILAKYGKQFTFELKAKMMGKKSLDAAQVMIDEHELNLTPENLIEERDKTLAMLFPSASLLPGVEKLVKHLKINNIPMAVATSSNRQNFKLKTEGKQENIDFFELFDYIVTGDEIENGKPAPDIFEKAISLFVNNPAKDPSNVLVFEDSPTGIKAAEAANMKTVMVPDIQLAETLKKGDLVLMSLEDFDPSLFGLPGY